MNSSKSHLPVFGVGPIYVGLIVFITLIAVATNVLGMISWGHSSNKIIFFVLGAISILVGASLFLFSNFMSYVVKEIKANRLVTTGVYGWVRNPIYSAYLFICLGVLLFCANWLLLILPLSYWLFLTILMRNTEEKWLEDLYGEEYLKYKRKVNRTIPCPPRSLFS